MPIIDVYVSVSKLRHCGIEKILERAPGPDDLVQRHSVLHRPGRPSIQGEVHEQPGYRAREHRSLGNILENRHVGMLFVDFFDSTVGLHVNGEAHTSPPDQLPPQLAERLAENESQNAPIVEAWVIVTVEEAYIHCSKHVPRLEKLSKPINWGTDDPIAKSNGYFVDGDAVG